MENLERWHPILHHLNIDMKHYDLVSRYAEKMAKDSALNGQDDDLLPLNLRAITKLDLNNIEIELVDPISNSDIESYTYSCLYEQEILNEYFIDELKHKMLDVLVDDINKLKSIKIHKLISSISLKNEGINEKGTYNIKMVIISRYAK